MDDLNKRSNKEKMQVFLGPLRIMYHKEKAKTMVDKMFLFLCKSAETIAWDAITHPSEDKEELRDESKRDTSCEETKIEDFDDHPTDIDEHEDINLWVGKEATQAVNYA